MPEWTEADTSLLVDLLERLPSPMPYLAFRTLCKRMPSAACELIVLRRRGLAIEVLLTKRPQNDPDWPGAWHYTGSVIRDTDTCFEDTIQRIVEMEIRGNLQEIPKCVGDILTSFKRGLTLQRIYVGILDESIPHQGSFFDIKGLPKPFIEEQLPGLEIAVKAFEAAGF
jgi:hypothetical protein